MPAFVMGSTILPANAEPIAIVGMACRLPGEVSNTNEFWDLLIAGKSGQCKIPKSRFNLDAFYHEDATKGGTINGTGGYFLHHDTRLFDNAFFGINNLEAKYMDPQQRQLLEVVYECLESAGVTLQAISGTNVGCYVANFTTDFVTMQAKDPDHYHRYSATGFGPTILANRISHIFNLHGPSVVLDTACSSSLYAIHAACAALNAGECDAAIVAGANLVQSPETYIAMAKAGVLSGTSTSHTFDSSVDGYGRGEAVAALFLRRLDVSLEEGGPIRSVIRGTAVNSNGQTSGITLPSALGQEAVIRKAYAMAGLSLDDTAYVEAHGTGTPVGDPIEIEAISNALQPRSGQSLLVGSVKTNIGHGEAVSGISSIIKATLSLEHGLIPPTIGIQNLNPSLKLTERNMEVVTSLRSWPVDTPRRISINSFGYGGANGHAILESAHTYESSNYLSAVSNTGKPLTRSNIPNGKPLLSETPKIETYLIPLSANSEMSLLKTTEDILSHGITINSVRDIAYTLGSHRSRLSNRDFLLATNAGSDTQISVTRSQIKTLAAVSPTPPFAFIFTGQGAQWPNMGCELISRFPVFRKTIQELDVFLGSLPESPSWTIQGVLANVSDTTAIYQASLSQPMCTAIQIGIINILREWNIFPSSVIGHSSGEICAAYAAEYVTAEEAVAIAYYRGFAVTRNCSRGSMLAVGLGHKEVSGYISSLKLNRTLCIACMNSPNSTTVSGESHSIDVLLRYFQESNVFVRKLKTDGNAYHSDLMKPAGKLYEALLAPIFEKKGFKDGNLPHTSVKMFSSVTSKVEGRSLIGTAAYWRQNLESTVKFDSTMRQLLSSASHCLIEVGPHPVLAQPIQDIQKNTVVESTYFSTLFRGVNSEFSMLKLGGELFIHGYELPFSEINGINHTDPQARILHSLPTYAWDHQEVLWSESRLSSEYRNLSHRRHDLLGLKVPGTPGDGAWWRNVLKVQEIPWLQDHKLGYSIVFPAAGFLAMAIEAVTQLQNTTSAEGKVSLRQVNLLSLLVLPLDGTIELSIQLRPLAISALNRSDTWWHFEISSYATGKSNLHANGNIAINVGDINIESRYSCSKLGLDTCDKQGMRMWYNKLAKEGLSFGPAFRTLTEISTDRGKKRTCAIAKSVLQQSNLASKDQISMYEIHPTTIDSVLQAAIIASTAGRVQSLCGKVPVLIRELDILLRGTGLTADIYTIFASSTDVGFGTSTLGGELISCKGKVIAQLRDVRAINYTETLLRPDSRVIRDPALRILWKPDISIMKSKDSGLLADYLKYFAEQLPPSSLGSLELPFFVGAVDLITHKNGRLKLLDLCNDTSESFQTLLENLLLEKTPQHFETYTRTTISATGTLLLHTDQKQTNGHIHKTLKREPVYDLVLIAEPNLANAMLNEHFNNLLHYLAPNATIICTCDSQNAVNLPKTKFSSLSASPPGSALSILIAKATTPPPDPVSYSPLLENGNLEPQKGRTPIIFVHPDTLGLLDQTIQARLLSEFGSTVEMLPFSNVSSTIVAPNSTVISTVEATKTVLANITETEMNAVKILTERASVLLWITGGRLFKAQSPEHSLVLGLARSLMLERPALKMPVLDLDNSMTGAAETCDHIVSVLQQTIDAENPDLEYRQYKGALYISRFVADTAINRHFQQVQDAEIIPCPVEEAGRCKLSINNVGQIDTLRFVEVNSIPQVMPGYVEVEVKVVGLNAKDFYALSDKIDIQGSTCALEFAGIVRRTGTSKSEFEVGDRVLVMAPNHFGTFEVVPEWACCKLQEHDNLTVMSTVPLVFSTALYALEDRARLQAGQSILIHSAAGGAGIAAIQIAKLIGAEIFATVGSDSKREFLTSSFAIPPSHIFSSRDATFLPGILVATAGKGVDVVLNSLTGELLHESWKVLAEFGTFVEIGKRDISDGGMLDMSNFKRGTTFTAFDLTDLFWSTNNTQRRVWNRLLHRSVDLIRTNKINNVSPLKSFPVSDLVQAFRYFSQSSRIGKVAVAFEGTATIPVVPNKFRTIFNPNKTYVLVGCLGGLGRSISRWLLSRGARNFVYIGRSGLDKVAASDLVSDLEEAGAEVTVIRGDVANYEVVELAVASATKPIGGIIQAAMSINVAMFSEMPTSTWHSGIAQKVQGTWNLHKAISGKDKELEFFLMLSSISGSVGAATESNYCAANSFLDSFGAYRQSIGLPGISVGLGMISEVGFLHENPETEAVLLRKGVHPFTEEELLQILDNALTPPPVDTIMAMDERIGADHYLQGHVLTGLELHGFQKNRDAGFIRGMTVFEDPRCSFIAGAFANSKDMSSANNSLGNGSTGGFPHAIAAELAANDNSSVPSESLIEAIQSVVIDRIATLLLVDSKHLQRDTLLGDFGMESMLAAEFRSDMFRAFKAEVPFAVLMDKRAKIRTVAELIGKGLLEEK